jgi:F420-non-reducing hydrogenase small subunit
MDTKVPDIQAMTDGEIAIVFFNGAIRSDENLEMTHLLRAKARLLVAFGACAAWGGIPALSNFHSRDDHLRSIYLEGPTIDNPPGLLPQTRTAMPEGELYLPAFHEVVRTLDDVVAVDYYIPGCPPEPERIWEVIEAVAAGAGLPPRGSVLGGGERSVCAECSRARSDQSIAKTLRTFETVPDSEQCLLEQGLVCRGVATRDGCGAPCPKANMPCIGCYGPPAGVRDQGAAMIAALGSVLMPVDFQGVTPESLCERLAGAYGGVPDGAGTYYKFTAGRSLLGQIR